MRLPSNRIDQCNFNDSDIYAHSKKEKSNWIHNFDF